MIPHNRPSIDASDQSAVREPLEDLWLAHARQTKQFEAEFAAYLGLPPDHAVAVANGTAALFLALWALNASAQDVYFPAYTCSSLRHAVALAGANERLLDIRPGTANVDSSNVPADAIAIVPHMYGIPAEMPTEPNVRVIEDVSQALGAKRHGVPLGLNGTIGIYSFYATKLITSAGQGGMLVSSQKDLVDAVRDYLDFDCRRDQKQRFNFQMTEIQAAMGRSQLQRLPDFLERRRAIYDYYRNLGLPLLDGTYEQSKTEPVRYRSVWLHEPVDATIEALKMHGVIAINPLEPWELLGDGEHFPHAAQLTRKTVSLPCYPSLSDSDLTVIGKVIQQILQH